jgi:hypothetical protein
MKNIVIASEARQSMQLDVMDGFTLFAMTMFHGSQVACLHLK